MKGKIPSVIAQNVSNIAAEAAKDYRTDFDVQEDIYGRPEKTPAPAVSQILTEEEEEIEFKTRRVFLLMKPSVHAKVKKLATKTHRSVNDLINEIVENALIQK